MYLGLEDSSRWHLCVGKTAWCVASLRKSLKILHLHQSSYPKCGYLPPEYLIIKLHRHTCKLTRCVILDEYAVCGQSVPIGPFSATYA